MARDEDTFGFSARMGGGPEERCHEHDEEEVDLEAPEQPEDEDEGQQFFITEHLGDNGRNLQVMSVSEVMDHPARQLVAGHFNTREEAEADLREGLASGKYSRNWR